MADARDECRIVSCRTLDMFFLALVRCDQTSHSESLSSPAWGRTRQRFGHFVTMKKVVTSWTSSRLHAQHFLLLI